MFIQTACPSCSGRIKVKNELVGKALKCPKCGERISIPAQQGVQFQMAPAALPDAPTTDHDPSVTPGPACTADFTPETPAGDARTVTRVPSQETEPQGTKSVDAETGQEKAVFKGHAGKVTSVAFSPDSNRVLTGSEDTTARLWDAKARQD